MLTTRMAQYRIDIIAGARPNFMKIAPIIRAMEARMAADAPLAYRLVHTGQHYDPKMSGTSSRNLASPRRTATSKLVQELRPSRPA